MNTAAPGNSGALKWIVIGGLGLVLIGILVWAGTQRPTGAARPADLAYLQQHKGKPGVKTTSSGLQYEVLTEGNGPKPAAVDTVSVHYEGKLVDGTIFDSSYSRGQPAVFALNQVIPGWTEGVQLMQTGAKYRFTIPPELGYGAAGAGGVIPPNAVLLFDVELLSVQGK